MRQQRHVVHRHAGHPTRSSSLAAGPPASPRAPAGLRRRRRRPGVTWASPSPSGRRDVGAEARVKRRLAIQRRGPPDAGVSAFLPLRTRLAGAADFSITAAAGRGGRPRRQERIPPLRQLGVDLACLGLQAQEVEARPEPGLLSTMVKGPLPVRLSKRGLHHPDPAACRRPVCRDPRYHRRAHQTESTALLKRGERGFACVLGFAHALHVMPQHARQHEAGRDRLAFVDGGRCRPMPAG